MVNEPKHVTGTTTPWNPDLAYTSWTPSETVAAPVDGFM